MTDMPYRPLGRTGLPVSRFCLGTATFGGQCDVSISEAILEHAADLGITFVDTADKYPIGSRYQEAGTTETIVGNWLRGRRDMFILAAKVHGPTGPRPWDSGLSRRHIIAAAEASLRRLQTDYIDLYQLHRPDPLTPIDETLAALDDLVHAGKVRYVGCSNFLAYQLARTLGRSEVKGLVQLQSVQPRYNLLFREHERELLPLCEEEGLAVLPYNVLAGGLLTGKHDMSSGPTEGTRFATTTGAASLYRDRYWHRKAFEAVAAISRVASDTGLAMPTLAAAWVLSRHAVTSVVLGATRPDHLDLPVAAASVRLDDDVLRHLDDVTARFRQGDAVQ